MPLSESGLKIGPVEVSGRVMLAPMSGVTDLPFRLQARRFGAALVVSEMVASAEYVRGEAEGALRSAMRPECGPAVVQLAGCDAFWMGEGARKAEAEGAAVVDINMGCPAKKVTGGYAGSALMRDLDHALRLIEAAVRAVAIPVTVKMRLGWDAASLNAPELARRAEDAGVRMITVHGRTRQQFYEGAADWSAVRRVREATRLPLVVNGDIVDASTARRALDLSGANAVMVGRAAMGRPWLLGRIEAGLSGGAYRGPSADERWAAMAELYDGAIGHYGLRRGRLTVRKHLAAFLAAEGEPRAIVERACTDEDAAAVLALLRSGPSRRLEAMAA